MRDEEKRFSTAASGIERTVAGRRNFLKSVGAAVVAGGGIGLASEAQAAGGNGATQAKSSRYTVPPEAPQTPPKGYNILFILTDQEHRFDGWPMPVPGRERMRREGTTFVNHQIASCVCSPSRSTIYTGQHIQHTGVLDNAGAPWQRDMSTDVRTVGRMMHDAGYYAAYLGKWHLSKLHLTDSPYDAPVERYNEIIKSYGFDDYFGVGDLVGGVLGGYGYDGLTTASAVSWLRTRAPDLAAKDKPWFMAVNLVNPHDAMFLNTDPVGVNRQNADHPAVGNARAPHNAVYEAKWNVPLAVSRKQPYDAPGRPPAHRQYNSAEGLLVGSYPIDDARLTTYQNYYFNCIRDCDAHVVTLLDTLHELGLDENTIVVMTSDHGDHVGAHKLVGKGPTAYREQNNVPLVIRHPAYPGGKTCRAVTSHIDIAPTLLALTGRDAADVARIAGEGARGHNLAPLLRNPEKAEVNALRGAALFNYAMLLFYDSEWLEWELKILREKGVSAEEIRRRVQTRQPDFRHRGMIRSAFDGRFRFSRYFSATAYNRPLTLEALFENNDVELYDLEADPDELNNLAMDRKTNGDLLMEMNARLSGLIDAEVGEDSPNVLPIRDGRVQF